ncbi:MAG: EAL domain-containing protein [Gammaproteobacteria bacterium]
MTLTGNELSLSRRLTNVMMIASCATLLLASILFITNDVISMRNSLEDELKSLVQIVSSSSAAAIMFHDEQSAEETLSVLSNLPNIQSATIYNNKGDRLASYGDSTMTEEHGFIETMPYQVLFSNGYIDVYNPVKLDNQRLGTVFIRSDLGKLKERLVWYLGMVGIVLLCSVFVAYFLSRRLQRGITEPIIRLANTARRVSEEKNYAVRASHEGQYEIGDLIDGFNEMLSEIQLRDNELLQYRTDLERIVAQRTYELEQINQKLGTAKVKAEQAADRLSYQAYHDALTGLPNRILLTDRMSMAFAHAKRENEKLALLFLDLDGFKLINDSLGHEVGDQLLRWTAELLQQSVREDDTVARLGGDEFMILLSNIQHNRDAGVIAQKILDALHQPMDCCGHELHLSASIGISIYPDDATDSVDLMRSADASMYRAKESGRNAYMYYQVDIGEASSRRLTLENQLRKAVAGNELFLEYQPQVSTQDHRIVGVEALVRWNNPQFGRLSPDQFVPIAEDTGLILEIGEWVMFEACAQAKRWHDLGHDGLQMAVNLSPRQFSGNNVELLVKNALGETRLPARFLEVEITENLSMQNVQKTIQTLHVVRDMGVKIAIDDFGTGYSSLNYLTKYPVNTLKIDRSFVQDIPQNKDDAALARAIVIMAHGLGLRVVAEGVETRAQSDFFRLHQCDVLQGYYFGKPESAESLTRVLSNQLHASDICSDLPESTTG